MSRAYDAVVVGAGHNGLVAANLLVDAGWDVVVLEAQDEPGGAVRSAETTAPGFSTDLFSAFYPLGFASPVLRGLALDAYGLRWQRAPYVLAHPLLDGRCAVLSPDPEETATSLEAFAAGDGEAWLRAYAQWRRIAPGVLAALFSPFPPVRPGLSLLRLLGPAETLRLARLAVLPVRRYGEEEYRGEGGRLLFAGNALHTDLSPEGAGSAVYGWLLAMLGQQVGFPVPEGGAGRLTDALVARLRARGGELHCSTPVTRVLLRGGQAEGVRTAGGEAVTARLAVLADVAAPTLLADLVGLEHLPGRVRADLNRFQWDQPTLKLNWALSGPVPWAAEPARLAGTVHVGGDLDALTRYAADLATGTMPREPFLLFGQMTTADPSRSPAGTESAWAYTHLPRRGGWGQEAVRRQVERMEQTLTRHAPGFSDLVLARHVQSPGDLQSADANLHAGAVNGGTAGLHQQLLFRPIPGLGRPETPIPRLYLASASAHPGGGVHGGPGALAARAAIRAYGAGGRLYRAGWRQAQQVLHSG